MAQTLTHVYSDVASAEQTVRDLNDAGLGNSHIGIVVSNAEGWHKPGSGNVDPKHDKDRDGKDDRSEGAVNGGGSGAIIGGTIGVITGIGAIAIPGVGPVVAAGWLAALVSGAVAGGAAGGIIGALVETGTSKENAALYAEALRRGGAIVTAKVTDDEVAKYKAIMSRNDIDVLAREPAYRNSGWTGYDPAAAAYTADEIRRERELYRR